MTEEQATALIASVNVIAEGVASCQSFLMVAAFFIIVRFGMDLWDDFHHKGVFTLGERMPRQ